MGNGHSEEAGVAMSTTSRRESRIPDLGNKILRTFACNLGNMASNIKVI